MSGADGGGACIEEEGGSEGDVFLMFEFRNCFFHVLFILAERVQHDRTVLVVTKAWTSSIWRAIDAFLVKLRAPNEKKKKKKNLELGDVTLRPPGIGPGSFT